MDLACKWLTANLHDYIRRYDMTYAVDTLHVHYTQYDSVYLVRWRQKMLDLPETVYATLTCVTCLLLSCACQHLHNLFVYFFALYFPSVILLSEFYHIWLIDTVSHSHYTRSFALNSTSVLHILIQFLAAILTRSKYRPLLRSRFMTF